MLIQTTDPHGQKRSQHMNDKPYYRRNLWKFPKIAKLFYQLYHTDQKSWDQKPKKKRIRKVGRINSSNPHHKGKNNEYSLQGRNWFSRIFEITTRFIQNF